MNTEPRWITFMQLNTGGRKTSAWMVVTKDQLTALGRVAWFGRFRCYSFYPEANTVYEKQCLRDIADFCEARTREHREARR